MSPSAPRNLCQYSNGGVANPAFDPADVTTVQLCLERQLRGAAPPASAAPCDRPSFEARPHAAGRRVAHCSKADESHSAWHCELPRVHYAELRRRSAMPHRILASSPSLRRIVWTDTRSRPRASRCCRQLNSADKKATSDLLGSMASSPARNGCQWRSGAELERALQARAQWLIEHQLADRVPEGQVQLKSDAPAITLRGNQAARCRFRPGRSALCPAVQGGAFAGIYERAITKPTAKLAVIRGDASVTSAPWRRALKSHAGPARARPRQADHVALTLPCQAIDR